VQSQEEEEEEDKSSARKRGVGKERNERAGGVAEDEAGLTRVNSWFDQSQQLWWSLRVEGCGEGAARRRALVV